MKTESPLILMVEDNPADAALIAEELRPALDRNAFALCNAGTMKEACQKLSDNEIAAVLLDLSLPDSHGIETFDQIAQQAADVPIVVLTGLDDSEVGLQAVRRGAQDFLVKGKIDAVTLERTLNYSVERKRREAEMRQRQSMEVMSQFADGIAHDFNNLLQVILGHLQTLEWPLRDNEELLREVRGASEAVIGGAALTRRLLAVTGRLPDEPALLDPNDHVARVSESLRKAFGDTTGIRTELGDNVWPVFADPAQLDMTILNIVNNARDAMAGMGEVTIRSGNFSVTDQNPAKIPGGDYVMIEIIDIGEGLSPEERKHMFDPLYSTRTDIRLKGLGLSMTQNFVRASGGHIGVRSVTGRGTTVTLYLPRAEVESVGDEVGELQSAQPTREEKILVLDENSAVRRTVSQYLWQLGFRTYEAESAGDAFALLDNGEQVALIVMDRRGVSGVQGHLLARKMRGVAPRVKILLLGQTDGDLEPSHGLPSDIAATLPKPCRLVDIERSINGLLGDSRSAA